MIKIQGMNNISVKARGPSEIQIIRWLLFSLMLNDIKASGQKLSLAVYCKWATHIEDIIIKMHVVMQK